MTGDRLGESMTRRAAAVLLVVAFLAGAALPSAAAAPDIIKRELIRESARISDIGQAAARESLATAFTTPLTEADVVQALSSAMISAGSSQYVDGFTAIVASGTASAIPHGDPSDDADNFILPGEVVVVDIGARYKGWVSDNTKTYFIGVEPPAEFVKIYGVVFEAQKRGYEAIATLMPAADLDAVARDYITEEGYGDFFIHCLGHGVGLYVHVPPLICTGSDDVLIATRNDVVAIEPGIYLENCFGVRIEDDFAVLRTGYERYTFAPSELSEIMVAPPTDWNGTSPTGEFANYTGCSFQVDAQAAAGAPRSSRGPGASGDMAVPIAAVGVAVIAVAVVLQQTGRVDILRSARGVPAWLLPKLRALPRALRRPPA